jgi:hypothetical protein
MHANIFSGTSSSTRLEECSALNCASIEFYWGKTPLFIYFTVALVHFLFCRTCRVAELLVRDDRPLLMSSAVCDLLENWRGRPGAPKDTQGSTAGNRHTVIFGVLKWHWLCAKLWYIPELPFKIFLIGN